MRITSKGQITIPKHIRDAVGLLPGHEAHFEVVGGAALIRPATVPDAPARIAQWLHSAPRPMLTGDQLIELARG